MKQPPSVLVILPPEFEEIEAAAPIDILRRAGAHVVVASLGRGLAITGRSGLLWIAEVPLATVQEEIFDMVFLPGGPGVKHLRADGRVRELVARFAAAKKWVAAICAAPTVLNDAGLLQGRRFTAHPSVAQELPQMLTSSAVEKDAPFITSRGAGTAVAFGLALVAVLFSQEKAEEIRRSICA